MGGRAADQGAVQLKEGIVRILQLLREQPGPGIAGATGIVAEAVVYSDGVAVLHWLTAPGGTEFYPSEADMRLVRESSGRSRFTEA